MIGWMTLDRSMAWLSASTSQIESRSDIHLELGLREARIGLESTNSGSNADFFDVARAYAGGIIGWRSCGWGELWSVIVVSGRIIL